MKSWIKRDGWIVVAISTSLLVATLSLLRDRGQVRAEQRTGAVGTTGQPPLSVANSPPDFQSVSGHHPEQAALAAVPQRLPDTSVVPVAWLQQAGSPGVFQATWLTQAFDGPAGSSGSNPTLTWPVNPNTRIPLRKGVVFQLQLESSVELKEEQLQVRVGGQEVEKTGLAAAGDEGKAENGNFLYSLKFEQGIRFGDSAEITLVHKDDKRNVSTKVFVEAISDSATRPIITNTTHSQFRSPDKPAAVKLYKDDDGAGYIRFNGIELPSDSNLRGYLFDYDSSASPRKPPVLVDTFDDIKIVQRGDRDPTYIAEATFPRNKRNTANGKLLITSRSPSQREIVFANRLIDFSVGQPAGEDVKNLQIKGIFSNEPSEGDVTQEGFEALKSEGKSLQTLHTIVVTAEKWNDKYDLRIEGLEGADIKVVNADALTSDPKVWKVRVAGRKGAKSVRRLRLQAAAYLGKRRLLGGRDSVNVQLLDRPLKVVSFRHDGVGVEVGANVISLTFPADQPLGFSNGNLIANFGSAKTHKVTLVRDPFAKATTLEPTAVYYIRASNTLRITYNTNELLRGNYLFTAKDIADVYGNNLAGDDPLFPEGYKVSFGSAPGIGEENALPGRVLPGIHGPTGKYVQYQEWTPQREIPNGFNPNDKVETRVSRLYFFRDAHRVSQIINRKVKSHNRHGVALARQRADQARTTADQITAARQQAEREAIRMAQETRRLEAKLSDARRNLDSALSDLRRESIARNVAALPKSAANADTTDSEGENGDENAETTTAASAEAAEADAAIREETIRSIEGAARTFSEEVKRLEQQVDSARQEELDAREQVEQKESEEQLARKEQFRREVAAAHADPDTYAEGVPDSPDPVEQTSISVIGEGLIHLRGPLKGVNQIRLMINQIDTPVGQVRVNIHSTQINGDDAQKLEVVSSRIQTYIDQARFMTVQTGEMVRKAVMTVAAQRAEEARTLYPGATQQERDQRYLHAFFGRDFVDELQAIDSEFLHTGNKLLSLHSMDVTSLSSALLLMALANNSTRERILYEFDRQLQEDLPLAEQRYIDAGIHHNDCRHCVDGCNRCGKEIKVADRLKRLWAKHHGPPPITSLSQNAAFQSLRGFFDSNLAHDDTMTPLQREFVRLAQIFKSRLITELEYKQRVMERALIEDRIGNREQELRDAKQKQDEADRTLAEAQRQKSSAIQNVVIDLTKTQAIIRDAASDAVEAKRLFDRDFKEFINDIQNEQNREEIKAFRQSPVQLGRYYEFYGTIVDGIAFRLSKESEERQPIVVMEVVDPVNNPKVKYGILQAVGHAIQFARNLAELGDAAELMQLSDALSDPTEIQRDKTETLAGKLEIIREEVLIQPTRDVPELKLRYYRLEELTDIYNELVRRGNAMVNRHNRLAEQRIHLIRQLKSPDTKFEDYYQVWNSYRTAIQTVFRGHPQREEIYANLERVDQQFDGLLQVDVQANFRLQEADAARRPLDHKKFLDMLIDDLEEKYIELLEGTRAHTANIDNYIKRLTTALDDDFNTQFYYPTFRNVREGSQFKDVEFGQTETTNVLANNREFAKVSPAATMEFDMPKRDILIKEGLDSALAIYNDVGALVNDPSLLALASSQSGMPTSGVTSGAPGAVRNVLPGLSSDTQTDLLAQDAGTRPRFESNVEKLIPDPAIYKFETGTGFEIRPMIEPDGQAVVFDFNYMYTTNVREPVRADEKHLGRVKRHFVDTDVQLSNFELREVSRYVVALKAERTARGVPLLEDIPVVGALWRPVPQREKSLQQNIIMAQATIFPTLFDLMGLRWAPSVADIDPLRLSDREFIVRGRHRVLENRVYDVSSSRVDEFLRVPEAQRRADLYRSQSTVPTTHPNGYRGPGLDLRDSQMREGYQLDRAYPDSEFVPEKSSEGSIYSQSKAPPTHVMPAKPYALEPLTPPDRPETNRHQLPAPSRLPPSRLPAVPLQEYPGQSVTIEPYSEN